MIDFLNNFYKDSLLLGWAFLLFFGLHLYFGRMPEKKKIKNYMRARKILGAAIFIWGVQILLQWCYDFRASSVNVATALNITVYYLCGNLIGHSFISLLDHKYITPERLRTDGFKVIMYWIVSWAAVLFLPETIATAVLYTAAFYFLIDISLLCVRFFRAYFHAKKQGDEYYTEDINGFIQWLTTCTYLIIVFGLTSALMAFAPKWAITMLMCAGIFVFIYMYVSFLNYSMYYKYVDAAVVDDEMETENQELECKENLELENLTKPSFKTLEVQVNQWIADKGYVESSINIEELARKFATNRTYLSLYIRERYDNNFRQFISQLRIDEAKRLIQISDMNISEVSFAVGFTSPSHFSRTFRQVELVSPQVWKRDNCELER